MNRLLKNIFDKSFTTGEDFTKEQINKFVSLLDHAFVTIEEDNSLYQRADKIAAVELEKMSKNLKDQNDLLDSFNHGLAHDIKNHTSNLTGLLWMLKKYKAKGDEEKVAEIIGKLEQSTEQLVAIVQGFLYLSRSEVDIKSNKEKLDVDALQNSILLEIDYLIRSKNATITFNFDNEPIFFSAHILRILMVNLITNGIKYSRKEVQPEIIVGLSKSENELVLTVADNGIGMDVEKEKSTLFNLYKRTKNAEAITGEGVGLFVIKKIVDLNNGTIQIKSEIGVGTQFRITLKSTN
jgi:signal transduction histidine kinase